MIITNKKYFQLINRVTGKTREECDKQFCRLLGVKGTKIIDVISKGKDRLEIRYQ